MELNLERPGDHHYIRSLNQLGIRIGDEYYSGSIIVSASRIINNWPPVSADKLQESDLVPILELMPEVLILGTGHKQVFLAPEMMASFYQNGIGIEVMKTDAACRTFNILVSEGRNVVAALIQQGHLQDSFTRGYIPEPG